VGYFGWPSGIIIATCKYQKINPFSSPNIIFELFSNCMADKTTAGVGFNAHLVFGQKY